MKHRKYRILSILLLACLALQAVIPGAWAEAAPEGWETLAPALYASWAPMGWAHFGHSSEGSAISAHKLAAASGVQFSCEV